jgi:hypothetical protein
VIVGLSSPTFDLNGNVSINALGSSDVDTIDRRVNRVKTLDGGVVVNDGGFSHGDRTVRIAWKVTNAAQFSALQYLVQTYSQLRLSLRDGVYLCAPYSLSQTEGEGQLELWLIESLSE